MFSNIAYIGGRSIENIFLKFGLQVYYNQTKSNKKHWVTHSQLNRVIAAQLKNIYSVLKVTIENKTNPI